MQAMLSKLPIFNLSKCWLIVFHQTLLSPKFHLIRKSFRLYSNQIINIIYCKTLLCVQSKHSWFSVSLHKNSQMYLHMKHKHLNFVLIRQFYT